ncbi:MAG: M20/M25/M40 family metallo-hydrolase, partial [Pseudomonadota bacterium]|nr:M20/M25/M40 family metallo-hydrolase [Pseudomonadota bacterium]
MIDPVALLQDLIRCASVTPLDEGAQDVLINALTPLGFKSYDVTRGNIRNTFLRYDGQAGDNTPHFCFAGHTDVVPVGDETLWTHPPFAAVIDDGKMFGRGTSDMKGNIACFVAAVAKYLENNTPAGSISLLITGDEEAEAINGTVKVLEWMEEQGQ